jgi:hypothetical protein
MEDTHKLLDLLEKRTYPHKLIERNVDSNYLWDPLSNVNNEFN